MRQLRNGSESAQRGITVILLNLHPFIATNPSIVVAIATILLTENIVHHPNTGKNTTPGDDTHLLHPVFHRLLGGSRLQNENHLATLRPESLDKTVVHLVENNLRHPNVGLHSRKKIRNRMNPRVQTTFLTAFLDLPILTT
ncbi:hypothetical protein BLNAU_6562 [Blattamonas nauphoetae]|uniref:Uncharacterized protein n=1 Tax=Blattamonas nauphoetae TaxID=2049346 RepID=A0ABQ9Y460_9EUKA|nr:hypothetical protein BLNAU_6562 [Blattamonas nauphoetae]